VLLDVHLPGVDGLTVCRQLKTAPETCLIPVLVMTGDTSSASHLEALEAGADDFLEKPLAIPELRARLRSASRMKRYIDELDNAAASILMLGAAIEARDRHTNGHCRRLAEYASALGQRIGLNRHDVRALEQGGYIHDLGKVAIADAVLFKPGPLTREEFDLVKAHPLVGDRICAPLRTLERSRPIIRSHHETLDGKGYPDGLRGVAVPLLAQVTAIADVYDALTSDRPYRRALTTADALEVLSDEATCGKRDRTLVLEFASIVLSQTALAQATA
jgi:putative two-component system response regulator